MTDDRNRRTGCTRGGTGNRSRLLGTCSALAATVALAGLPAPALGQSQTPPVGAITLDAPTLDVAKVRSLATPTPAVVAPALPSAPSPLTQFDTRTDGVNVRATASYDSTRVGFNPGASADVVTMLAGEAIIDWTTFGAGGSGTQVGFLPQGAKLQFTSAGTRYTVLNRIFTPGFDSAVRIDGAITSDIAGATGGNVWFYSAGGIVVGGSARFDVGGLVLSSTEVDFSNGLLGSGNRIAFTGNVGGGGVTIEPHDARFGAAPQISAGDYFAVLAPRIAQHGQVSVDGEVALIAAEQAALTIDNGLFDIEVLLGSGDVNGIVHTGTTTGAAADGAARQMQLVAVSKNDAITMLVSGSLGYQAAASASAGKNGQIILSAGDPARRGDGNIDVGSTSFTSDVTAFASGSIDLTMGAGDQLVVGSDASGAHSFDVTALDSIQLAAIDGGSILVDGNLRLDAGGDTARGGAIELSALSGGAISIGGNLALDVSADATGEAFDAATGKGAAARAGSIELSVLGGALDVGGALAMDMTAKAGSGGVGTGAGAFAFTTLAEDSATMAAAAAPSAGDGGDAYGGTAVFDLQSAYGTVADFTLSANAIGGDGVSGSYYAGTSGGRGGNATGGTATFNALSGSMTVTGSLQVTANAYGGSGGSGSGTAAGIGGSAQGGSANFNNDGTAVIDAGRIVVTAHARGGSGGSGLTGYTDTSVIDGTAASGGDAIGGTARLTDRAGGLTSNYVTVGSNASGGYGGYSSSGTGGAGGSAHGGSASILFARDNAAFGYVEVNADGYGGFGGSGINGGTGGYARGGNASASVTASGVELSSLTITAEARGGGSGFAGTEAGLVGNGGDGGAAQGGSVELTASGAGISLTTSAGLSARATGGRGREGRGDYSYGVTQSFGGAGGSATGGSVAISSADGAALTITVDELVDARGFGGEGGDGRGNYAGIAGQGGAGGDGTGGSITTSVLGGGTIQLIGYPGYGGGYYEGPPPAYVGTATLGASGIGGLGGGYGGYDTSTPSLRGANGRSYGGSVLASASGAGSLLQSSNDFVLDAAAKGVRDTRDGAFGGYARGGSVSVTTELGGAVTVTGNLLADASARPVVQSYGYSGEVALLSVSSAQPGVQRYGYGDAGGNTGAGSKGGLISISNLGSLSASGIVADASGIGASGTVGGYAFTSGAGGNGTGGSIDFVSATPIAGLANLTLDASGTGGAGAAGGYGYDGGGPGTDAGNGYGGSVSLEFTGPEARLAGLSSATLVAAGIGGTGGSGGDGFTAGGTGGNGGTGTGGNVSIISSNGAVIDLTDTADTILADGIGGAGGVGGNVSSFVSTDYLGSGGNGGYGSGGILTITAAGGSVLSGDITLTANGRGGAGGQGGYNSYSSGGYYYFGTSGSAAGGAGGIVTLQALGAGAGAISLGATSLRASGIIGYGGSYSSVAPTTGGRIVITDASEAPGGLTFGSLRATAYGAAAPVEPAFSMSGSSGPIAVTGEMYVIVTGDADFAFTGSGQVTVGGFSAIYAGGDILVTHSGNDARIASIDSGDSLRAVADGNFTSGTGSIIRSAAFLSVNAGLDLAASDLRSTDSMFLEAGQNVTLQHAAVTGAPSVFSEYYSYVSPSLSVVAGASYFYESRYLDPGFGIAITGSVSSTGTIDVAAGGNAVFSAGSSVVSDNGLTVTTGDDIIIEAGARLEAGANPATSPDPANPFVTSQNLILAAGASREAGGAPSSSSGPLPLTGAPPTPISSIVARGTIAANGFAVELTGNAIDARGSTISGSSIRADIEAAPAAGAVQSNDAGLLTAPCLEGAICLGTISAANSLSLGQNSDNGVVALSVENAAVSANDILITVRGDIAIGASGFGSVLTSVTRFVLASTSGNVSILDTIVSADSILVSAAGSLLGNGSLISPNDIGITVGRNLSLGGIETGGQLTTVAGVGGAPETGYTIVGDLALGSLVQGSALPFVLTAGGSIAIGNLALPASFSANAIAGDITLGNVTIDGDVTLDSAGFVTVSHLEATGSLVANAATGFATSATSLITGGDIVIAAGGPVDLGNSSAGGLVDVTGSQIDFISVTAGGTLSLVTQPGSVAPGTGNITGTSLAAGAGPSLLDAFGSLSVSGTSTFGGSVLLEAAANVLLGGVTAANNLDAIAGAGLQAGVLRAGSGLSISAGIDAAIGDSESADGDILVGAGGNITGVRVSNAAATASGSDIVLSAGGGISLSGASSASAAFTASSGGTITLPGSVTAGGAITLDAASTIAFRLLQAGGSAAINAGGAIGGIGDIAAGSDITLVGQTIELDAIATTGNVSADASLGHAIFGAVQADGSIVVDAAGAATLASATSGVNTTVVGASVTLGSANAAGALALGATAGEIIATGALATGSTADLTASGAIALTQLQSSGDMTLTAGSSIGFGLVQGGGFIAMNAGGPISGGDLSASGGLTLDGGSIAVGTATADSISLVSGGDVGFTLLSSPNAISVTARSGLIVGGGDINAGGDVTLASQSIGLDAVAAGGSLSASTSVGGASFGAVEAGADILIDSAGAATLASATSGANTTVAGQSVALAGGTVGSELVLSARAGDIDATDATSAGGIALDAAGGISFATLAAQGGDFRVTASGNISFTNAQASGALDFASAGSVNGMEARAGTSLALAGDEGTSIGTAAGATIALTSLSSEVAVTQDLAPSGSTGAVSLSGASIRIEDVNDLRASSISATAGSIMATAAGDLVIGEASAAGDVTFASTGGTARVAGASGGAIAISSAGALTLEGAVSAAQDLSLTTAGLLTVNASAAGSAIEVNAADIAIDASGTLGDATRTGSITLTTSGDATIGGSGGSGSDFVLENAEVARIHSQGDLSLNAANLTVGTLDVAAGAGANSTDGTMGRTGTLSLFASGNLRVTGNATISGATTDTRLSLEGVLVRLDSANGGLFMLDAAGAGTGGIAVFAQDFMAVTDSAFADLQSMTTPQVDARLALNDGVDRADGVVRAGSFTITTSASRVFIQNTAPGTAFADRRGITVDTLTIAHEAGTVQPVVINGVVGGATGIDAIAQIEFAGTLDAASTVNGCLVANPASCSPGGFEPPRFEERPDDLLEEEFRASEQFDPAVTSGPTLVDFTPSEQFRDDPLIDDPVTGVGNEDLWLGDPECSDGSEDGLCGGTQEEGEPREEAD